MTTKELLQKIRKLEIKTKGVTKHVFSGEYHSAFKGRGMAFNEVRDYHFGDETRNIDWNVTARFNTPFIKVFEEERELTVMLIIDISGSGEYGTAETTKKNLALEIAAILAFSAISNNDKVGAIFVTDQVEKYIAPEKGRKHGLVILRELIEFKPISKGTDLNTALKFFRNTQKKRSISFVLSDFMDTNNFMEGMKVTNKKHDMVAIHMYDKAEYQLPKMGYIQLKNAETGEKTWINSNSVSNQQQHESTYHLIEQRILKDFKKVGIDCASISTSDDYIKQLMALLKRRG
jgi:uncharacterized protein (DUF58 family)